MKKIVIMYSNGPPSPGHVGRLARLAPGRELVVADSEESAIRHAPDAEIFLGHRYLWQTLPTADRLRWVQSTAGGPEHLMTPDFLRRRPVLTRCAIFSEAVAWHAFALLLALARGIPEAMLAQLAGRWAPGIRVSRLPQRALVLGLGEIGLSIANILRRNAIKVIGTARERTASRMAAVDEFVGPGEWRPHLPSCDVCFLCLPATPATRRLFDSQAMDALPQHAFIVNVGRGETLDTPALVERLTDGRLAGAALDVTEHVPGPDDPLWRCPRLLITPKIGTFFPGSQEVLERFVEDQVRRYFAGAPLLYQIDLKRGLS